MAAITLHSYHAVDEDANDGDRPEAKIKLWCLEAETNRPAVVIVDDFFPSCYIELPPVYHPYRNKFSAREWTPVAVSTLMSKLAAMVYVGQDESRRLVDIVSHQFQKKSKLYYYQPKERQFPMVHVRAKSYEDLKALSNFIERSAYVVDEETKSRSARVREGERGRDFGELGRLVLRCWESTSVPNYRKFFTEKRLTMTGWFRIRPSSTVVPESPHAQYRCTEYHVDALDPNSFVAVPEEEAMAIKPSAPGVLAYDIETYSDNHRAFPDAENPKHVITMISAVYQRTRDPSTRKRFLLTTKAAGISSDPNHPAYENGGRPDEFIIADTEGDMLIAFADLIHRLDPEILTGYNTPIYDNPYLHRRYKLECDPSGQWPQKMSRSKENAVTVKFRRWKSGGTGIVEDWNFTLDGIIAVDLLPLVKREVKLTKYSLDSAAKHYLGSEEGKHDVDAPFMFRAYEAAVATSGLAPEDPMREKAVADMTKVGAYGIQDSELVIRLFEEINVWIGLLEMSSVTGVTMRDTFSRGQQCRIISLLYDLAHPRDIVMDQRSLPRPPRPMGPDGLPADGALSEEFIRYTGGFVGDTIPGLHGETICVDFASLYPSIMRAFNISHDTLLVKTSPIESKFLSGKAARYDAAHSSRPIDACDVNRATDPRFQASDDTPTNDITFVEGDAASSDDEGEEKCVPAEKGTTYSFSYVKDTVRVGLIPMLVESLVDKRAEVRGRIAELKKVDPSTETPEQTAHRKLTVGVYNQRQLSLKVTANSAYGFIGAQRGGMFPVPEGAMSVTAWGRQLIQRVYSYVIDTYGGRIIGGDTDSCFFQLPDQIKTPKDCDYWGNRLAQELTDLFPKPLRLEYEKGMRMLALKKKMYAALLINPDGTYAKKMLVRGIAVVRRDKCKFLTNLQSALLDSILYAKGVHHSLELILGSCIRAMESPPDPAEFEIVKSLNSRYKSSAYQMAVFERECTKAGCPVRPGDRLAFVIVNRPSSIPSEGSEVKVDNLGLRMRLTDAWVAGGRTEPIDIEYYLSHMCMNPIDQVFGVAYAPLFDASKPGATFRPRSNVCYSALSPIKMTLALLADVRRRMQKQGHATLTQSTRVAVFKRNLTALKDVFDVK